MKKKTSSEMPIVRQNRYPSPNPDLAKSTAIPYDKANDLEPCLRHWQPCNEPAGECTFRVKGK